MSIVVRLLLVLGWLSVAGGGRAAEFYVAPGGDDAQPGTLEKPFATLDRAQREVRKVKAAGPVTVFFRGGRYQLDAPVEFTPADSGGEGRLITYAAYAQERPVFSGGQMVGGWQKHDQRLWVADVSWVKDRPESLVQLFVNGQRRTLARSPNSGTYFYSKRLQLTPDQHPLCTGLTWSDDDLGPWANTPDARIVLFHNWVNSFNRIKEFLPARKGLVFARPAGIFFLGPRVRYYIENVREALDAPGEWYLDRAAGRLYYYPLPGEDLARAEVILPVVQQTLVKFTGNAAAGPYVEHLAFRGLAFQHTDADLAPGYPHSVQGAHTQKGAIFAVGLRRTVFERCEFSQLGEHAVSLREGCHAVTVRECHLHDLGGGGVYLSEGAPAKPADDWITAHNVVENNFIHDGGYLFRAGCGVFLGGSASHNRILNNEICDLSWMGVHLGWSWTGKAPAYTHHNEVAYNHIHHLGNGVLNDIGGIYTLGVSTGTLLHHNLIHDVTRFERGKQGYGGWGIYLDAGSSEIRVEDNVVYRTRDGGLHLHCDGYPYGDVVVNNVFAYSQDGELMRNNTKESDKEHVHLERNLVYGQGTKMYSGGNWRAGSNFSADKNAYWSTSGQPPEFRGLSFAQWQAEGHDRHGLVADPGFVDPQAGNFALRPKSPALAVGFQPIDVSRVGLRGAPSWVELPTTVKHRAFETAPPPEPAATTFIDDFEQYAVGERPDNVRIIGETKDASIRVTAETAAAGKQCLKIVDAPGLKFGHDPHWYAELGIASGPVSGSFALRVEPGAIVYHEWRDWPPGEPIAAGPSLRVEGDGRLIVGGKPVAKLPHGQWVRFEIAAGTGPAANGTWQLTLRAPGQEPLQLSGLKCNPKFKTLTWFGFCSMATEATTFYLDNVQVGPR